MLNPVFLVQITQLTFDMNTEFTKFKNDLFRTKHFGIFYKFKYGGGILFFNCLGWFKFNKFLMIVRWTLLSISFQIKEILYQPISSFIRNSHIVFAVEINFQILWKQFLKIFSFLYSFYYIFLFDYKEL